jgi:uncharacterized protein (DUF2336 family)
MSHSALLAELEVAIKSGSQERRVETLRRVTSLFLGQSHQLSEPQIEVFDDVLVHLIRRIESKALIQLSEALAPVANAPTETVWQLADHDDASVAEPVLTHSSRLSDSGLVHIAKHKRQRHLLAISKRASLAEALTDVLVQRGDMAVHHSLVANPGARFSQSGFTKLVDHSQNDDELTVKLGERLDLPFKLLRVLMARATDLVRSRLLASASPKSRERIKAAHAGATRKDDDEMIEATDFMRADNLVLQLNRQGKLNETVLAKFIEKGCSEEMMASLALFCGAKSELIERLLRSARYEGLILACRAANLSWQTTSMILCARLSDHAISESELTKARDTFLELSQAVAQKSFQFLKVQQKIKSIG